MKFVNKYRIVLYMIFIFVFVFILINSMDHIISNYQKSINLDSEISHKWKIRSIDTMKYSRDLARLKLGDDSFDMVIDQQMAEIEDAGANYVAIGTPYDEEFLPLLKRWVDSARKHNLKVWFRGNFSGWEGWFEYDPIDMETHKSLTREFITKNADLFVDGDIFTSCPECENGVNTDWHTAEGLEAHRNFLIEEHEVAVEEFENVDKNVESGYYSMNGDLARALMDRFTTKALGGYVVIDHYVESPDKLASDIEEIAEKSGGKVILGEFGVPIPDIHGKMTEEEQDEWLKEALSKISQISDLVGLNYWVGTGGSTALWTDDGRPKEAVKTLRNFYRFLGLKVLNKNS